MLRTAKANSKTLKCPCQNLKLPFVKDVHEPTQTPSLRNWPKLKDGTERDCRTNLRRLKPGCRRRGSLIPSGPSGGGAALAAGPPRAASSGQRCGPWGWHAHFGCVPLCRAPQYLSRAANSTQRRASRLPAPPSPLAKQRANARDRRYQSCQRSATNPRPGWRGRGPWRLALPRLLPGALSEDTARRAPGSPTPGAAGSPLPVPPAKLAQAFLGARGAAVRAPCSGLCPGFVRAPRPPALCTPSALPTFWMVC